MGRKMSATATDATYTEITSATGTLSLYKVAPRQVLTHYMAEYAAGLGIFRIRNTASNKVKGYGVMDVLGEMRYRRFRKPITVEQNDIVEAYVDVA
jgi:hypothetical protein